MDKVRHAVRQVLAAYSRRGVRLIKIIYGDTGVETEKWTERRDGLVDQN